METMSIHRGLAELKLIDEKITKKIEDLNPTGTKQKDKLINGHLSDEEFKEKAESSLQSIEDLIERKSKIKSAIVKANGETTVEVAGKSMTVADAITAKTSMAHKKALANTIKASLETSLATQEQNTTEVDSHVQQILLATFGKENVKAGDKDVEAVRKPYLEANEHHLVDPLKAGDKVDAMVQEIDEFEADVDATLSEINAITQITVN